MLSQLKIGGMVPFTTIDFPGRLASVLFLRGCNLRCRYCHNPELLDRSQSGTERWSRVESFLKARQGFLEGVVLSGGEPTLEPLLPELAARIRDLGYEIALHTNGARPDVIKHLIDERLVHFVALDVKGPFDQYQRITGADQGMAAAASVRLLNDCGLPHEFRSTVHPDLLSDHDLISLGDQMHELGARKLVLQRFREGKILDTSLNLVKRPWAHPTTIRALEGRLGHIEIRGFDLPETIAA